jgi:Cu/Ag efflux pump CusA
MQWIILSSLRQRMLVIAVAAVLSGFGLWQLRSTPFDVIPEFSPPSLVVKTEALGLSSTEVEALITVPLEADLLNGVPWLRSIESESMVGVSTIELSFAPGTDLMRARQMVQERLTQAHAPMGLPPVGSPSVLLQPVSSASRIMNIGLSSATVPLIEMTVQAHWNIVPRLTGIPGVANVSIWGRRMQQIQVQVVPETLHEHGVTLENVVRTAGEAVWASPLTFLESSTPGTGGFIDTPNQRLNIRHVSPLVSPEAFSRLPVFESAVTLGEIARVLEGHQPLIGDAIVNDGPGLMLVVEKFPGFNTQEVTRAIEAALEDMRPGLKGIDIGTTIYRPAGFIERAAGNLATALLVAGALLVACLVGLLQNWRAALIAAIAVPLSLLAAGLVLHLRGVGINMMVVAGLMMAIGAVVHDAILDVENIARRLRQPRGEGGGRGAGGGVLAAALEVRRPMLFATLILLLAVAPVFFVEGLTAALLKPLIWSYTAAVLASLLVALTVTPALCLLLLPPAPAAEPMGPGVLDRLHAHFERRSGPATRSLLPSFGIAAVAALIAVVAWSRLERALVPDLKETDVVIEWQGPPGMALPAMTQTTSGLIRDLRTIPGVRNAAATIGRAVLCNCDEVADVNAAQVWVSIDPAADRDGALAAIRAAVADYPGMSGRVDAYLSNKMREALTGDNERIAVRVYGHDLNILRGKAEEIRALLAQVEGVGDPHVEQQAEEAAIEVEVDLDRASAHGLKPGDVRRATATLVGGLTVGALFEQQKVFDVVVWGAPEVRDSIDRVGNLMLDTEDGAQVRLAEVAQVRLAPATSIIRRQGVSRRIDVEAEVVGRPASAVARDVAARIRQMSFPFEYHAEVLGEHVEPRAALSSVGSYLVAAAALIFLVLQAALGSWRLAALSAIGVPVALLGSVLAVLLDGGVVSLGALLGCVTVLGLTVRTGIMMVGRFQALERHEGEAFGEALVRRGVRELFPSTVATLVTTGVLVLPLVVLGNVAGLEIVHPMAVAILGGLVGSAVVTLVMIPALYLRFGAGTATDTLGLEPAPR